MKIRPLKLNGTFEITLTPKADERGYFMRSYDRQIFADAGLVTGWQQENQSLSTQRGTIRGLHFQKPPFSETKLVRVISGSIFDIFVDLRAGSETYGQWDSVDLDANTHKMVYVPRGFAHGFCTLSSEAIVQYKVDSAYAPEHEDGIRWNDPDLAIEWPEMSYFVSERDQQLQLFRDFKTPFQAV